MLFDNFKVLVAMIKRQSEVKKHKKKVAKQNGFFKYFIEVKLTIETKIP